jgi:hypothetical protein
MEEEVDDKSPYIKAVQLNQKADSWLSSFVNESYPESIFLWLHYMDMHEPYVPDKKYIKHVDPTLRISDNEMFAIFQDVLLNRDVSNIDNVQLLKKLYQSHVYETDAAIKNLFSIVVPRWEDVFRTCPGPAINL